MNKSYEFVLRNEDGSPAVGEEMTIKGRTYYSDHNGKFHVIDTTYLDHLISQAETKK